MRAVYLLFELISRKTNLLRVDDYDVIATIQIGSEVRLVLADQHTRYRRGYAAQNLAGGIHHNPFWTLR